VSSALRLTVALLLHSTLLAVLAFFLLLLPLAVATALLTVLAVLRVLFPVWHFQVLIHCGRICRTPGPADPFRRS
jgi:hypothetical protein